MNVQSERLLLTTCPICDRDFYAVVHATEDCRTSTVIPYAYVYPGDGDHKKYIYLCNDCAKIYLQKIERSLYSYWKWKDRFFDSIYYDDRFVNINELSDRQKKRLETRYQKFCEKSRDLISRLRRTMEKKKNR